MKLESLIIGDLTVNIPIIQGAMGIGVSKANLAAAVANEGGMGVIAGIQIGFLEPDFEDNTLDANNRALINEIRKARELSPHGIIGVNFMVCSNNYEKFVRTAVEEEIDIIISGAGLPKELPAIVEGSKTKIAPIVSSGRSANLICKLWDKRFNRIPDLIVVEGPNAGGHLGYSMEELAQDKLDLAIIFNEVLAAVKPYEEKYKVKIPVAVAGGIFTGKDIAHYLKLGASAVQMATRFIATEECDAHIDYKNMFVNAKEGDIQLLNSPVGMPGRAIRNKFIEQLENAPIKINKCYGCIKPCNPKEAQFCISKALINAVKGNVDEGLVFSGSNAHRIDKIVKVKELIRHLVSEAEDDLRVQ
ncbi:MAG: NAD(P)H-dependent flavin oxidoreductase [Bacillota bacterium]